MAAAARSSSIRRTLAGLIALVAVLCLPALHALHLRLEGDGDHAAVVDARGEQPAAPKRGHDAGHCAICLSFQSTGHAASEPDLTVARAFDAPTTFATDRYVAPLTSAVALRVAVPRGPPAPRA